MAVELRFVPLISKPQMLITGFSSASIPCLARLSWGHHSLVSGDNACVPDGVVHMVGTSEFGTRLFSGPRLNRSRRQWRSFLDLGPVMIRRITLPTSPQYVSAHPFHPFPFLPARET